MLINFAERCRADVVIRNYCLIHARLLHFFFELAELKKELFELPFSAAGFYQQMNLDIKRKWVQLQIEHIETRIRLIRKVAQEKCSDAQGSSPLG